MCISADRAPGAIVALWPAIVEGGDGGTIWDAKAMTAAGREQLPYDESLIVVDTPNYFERGDLDRVRDRLRDAHGVTAEIGYKPDIYTRTGVAPETAGEYGLPRYDTGGESAPSARPPGRRSQAPPPSARDERGVPVD